LSSSHPTIPDKIGAASATVSFERSQVAVVWDDKDPSLLDLALRQGIDADYHCRQGFCGTCDTVGCGDVEYVQDILPPFPEPGRIRICSARPIGAVKLEL
jgi:ferredoxin